MHGTHWDIPISPNGINGINSAPPHPILIKILSIIKEKCPDTCLAFILWASLIGNQTLKERKTLA